MNLHAPNTLIYITLVTVSPEVGGGGIGANAVLTEGSLELNYTLKVEESELTKS